MKDVIKLIYENLAAVPFANFHFFLVFVHHINFGPEGMSLPVSASFFTDSLLVFFLPVILELAVIVVCAVLACIVARSRSRQGMSRLVTAPGSGTVVVLLLLEHGDVIFLILSVLVVHDGHWLYGATFSLLGGYDVIHLVQSVCRVVLLDFHMSQLAWEGSLEWLHFEKLHHIVDGVAVVFLSMGSQVSTINIVLWCCHLVPACAGALLGDDHGVGDSVEEIAGGLVWFHCDFYSMISLSFDWTSGCSTSTHTSTSTP
jgi:hypothetical protein